MNIAAAGHLMLFFSVLVGLILVGLVVFSYAAYSFLLTLTNSAAGNDEVIWPGEPITDWFFKMWYLGWLLAVWAVPASFLIALLDVPGWLSALYLAGLLWLIFPIALLSSLSAESQLVVLRPAMLRLLLTRPGTTLFFYASSAVVVLVCVAFGSAALLGVRRFPALDQPMVLLPLAAFVEAVGCLIYARLLGRTAYVLSYSGSERRRGGEPDEAEAGVRAETVDTWPLSEEDAYAERKPRRRPPSLKGPPKKDQRRAKKPERGIDPWAVPSEEAVPKKTKPTPSAAPHSDDPYGPAEGTYAVMAEAASLPPEASSREDVPVEPYSVSTPSDRVSGKRPPVVPEVSKLEEELAAPRRLPPPPDWPLVTGVYSFPFYPQSIGPCGTLALGFFLVLGLSRLLLYLFPS